MSHKPSDKVKVGITQGDSNGIGYEVIIKSLSDERILDMFTPIIYGSSKMFAFYRKTIHNLPQINTNIITDASQARPRVVNIINCIPETSVADPGLSNSDSAKCAILSLERAVADVKAGLIDTVVTAPINKKAMIAAGFEHTGHTEWLQSQFGTDDVLMFMVSQRIKIAVVTGHIPLKDVPVKVTPEAILGKLRLMSASLKRDFGFSSPKIAVLGLNPHCGDGGLMGEEEQKIIAPGIKLANDEGIMAFGPYSPDGFFGTGNYEKYDAVLAMYHDQGLIPFKTLAFEEGVNFTAGLPIVRTSPDHGTAYDMAGRDLADPRSMMASIHTSIDIFRNRIRYDEIMAGRLEINDSEGLLRSGAIE